MEQESQTSREMTCTHGRHGKVRLVLRIKKLKGRVGTQNKEWKVADIRRGVGCNGRKLTRRQGNTKATRNKH
jgi:hypothetical protein